MLWQLTGEIANAAINGVGNPSWLAWLAVGTPFSLATVPDLVPDAGLWVVGMLLTLAVVGAAVGAGVGRVLHERTSRFVMALSAWMIVVIAGAVGHLVALPVLSSYQSAAMSTAIMPAVYRGAGWGVVIGAVVTLLVVVLARPPVTTSPAADHATSGASPDPRQPV